MVLTGPMFADVCRGIWGKDWKSRVADRLRRSERQLRNLETGRSNVSPKLRAELRAIIRAQIEEFMAYERSISE